MGTAPGHLGFHIRAAMNTGATRQEVAKTVTQISVSAILPACINAVAGAETAFQTAHDG